LHLEEVLGRAGELAEEAQAVLLGVPLHPKSLRASLDDALTPNQACERPALFR
jgi:hypothetical protein